MRFAGTPLMGCQILPPNQETKMSETSKATVGELILSVVSATANSERRAWEDEVAELKEKLKAAEARSIPSGWAVESNAVEVAKKLRAEVDRLRAILRPLRGKLEYYLAQHPRGLSALSVPLSLSPQEALAILDSCESTSGKPHQPDAMETVRTSMAYRERYRALRDAVEPVRKQLWSRATKPVQVVLSSSEVSALLAACEPVEAADATEGGG